jgi:hypothetical protein
VPATGQPEPPARGNSIDVVRATRRAGLLHLPSAGLTVPEHNFRAASLDASVNKVRSLTSRVDDGIERFQEIWARQQGQPFEFEGELVHPILRRTVEPDTAIEITVLHARETPVQGLVVSTKGRSRLAWDEHDIEGRSVRLWADKQQTATLRTTKARDSTEISVWNVWLDRQTHAPGNAVGKANQDFEVIQAWWAWSGMRIHEHEDGTVELRCSGSYDGPDFDDLVARIAFSASPAT